MYELSAPTLGALEAFDACVGVIQKKVDREPYVAVRHRIQSASEAFGRLTEDQSFDRAHASMFTVAPLDSKRMTALYDDQFTQRKGTARMREAVKNAAPNKLCPYCGEGTVSELDHFLPKTDCAGLAVNPSNLVPACGDCNEAKKSYMPSATSPAVLHPYFDSSFAVPWLSARVDKGSANLPVVEFHISLPMCEEPLRARLEAHMSVFKLYERFRVWAAQSLTNFEYLLTLEEMSRTDAERHLGLTASQQSGGRINSWERAAHLAMRDSDWYLTHHLGLR